MMYAIAKRGSSALGCLLPATPSPVTRVVQVLVHSLYQKCPHLSFVPAGGILLAILVKSGILFRYGLECT